jgi:hypothetical protein
LKFIILIYLFINYLKFIILFQFAFKLQEERMECFIADGHYLEGLAACALVTWRGGVELKVKARRAAMVYLANTSVRAFAAWKAAVAAAKASKAKSDKVGCPNDPYFRKSIERIRETKILDRNPGPNPGGPNYFTHHGVVDTRSLSGQQL